MIKPLFTILTLIACSQALKICEATWAYNNSIAIKTNETHTTKNVTKAYPKEMTDLDNKLSKLEKESKHKASNHTMSNNNSTSTANATAANATNNTKHKETVATHEKSNTTSYDYNHIGDTYSLTTKDEDQIYVMMIVFSLVALIFTYIACLGNPCKEDSYDDEDEVIIVE